MTNKRIKFVNEEGDALFEISDGNAIHIYDENTYDFVIRCHYVDDDHFLLGARKYQMHEFIKDCAKAGRRYVPETVPEDYGAAWCVIKSDGIGYLSVQELSDEPGWDCQFYDAEVNEIDSDIVSEEEAQNLIEARNKILEDHLAWDNCYMKPVDFEDLTEQAYKKWQEKVNRFKETAL